MKLFRRRRKFAISKSHFLPIFNQQAAFVKQASTTLYDMARSADHVEWFKLEKEVKQCEVQGDAMLAEFYELVYEVSMPPMDRDDLQTLAMNIDEFLDLINTAAKSILLYMPEKIDQQLVDIAQYVDAEADAIKEIIMLLKDMKDNFTAITMQCDRITELEHAGDDAYEEYIGEIFRTEKNAVELMKYKNMAEVFEAATDSAKRLSDHIRKLLLRYL